MKKRFTINTNVEQGVDMKPVTVVMKRLTNALSKNEVFQVHKAINTLQVKVGDKIEEDTISKWIKDKENWTVQFIK